MSSMQQRTGSTSDDGEKSRSSSSSTPASGASNPPLVIVSERGRHSTESRRIVRAQAARASAAQSRVTRARNRGDREGALREERSSPGVGEGSRPAEASTAEGPRSPTTDSAQRPLVVWLSGVLNVPIASLFESFQAQSAASSEGDAGLSPTGRGSSRPLSSLLGTGSSSGEDRPQLPTAIPRGFTTLQQVMPVSDDIMVLIGRTSCFDFDSPGVLERLHQLLFDLIVGPIAMPPPGPSIQDYLRIACVCLTIFQGQRANGAVFAYDQKYARGLEAAWVEATFLDRAALKEPKAAEASLWAEFIINVTTGASGSPPLYFLRDLLEYLQIDTWAQFRSTLLDFIFPVSFLDGPSKRFYDSIQQRQRERAR